MRAFKIYSFGTSKKVIFFLTGWDTTYYQFWLFAKILQLFGFRVMLYLGNEYFFTPDIERTVRNFNEEKESVLNSIKKLQAEGCTEFSIYSLSQGTSLALMVAKESDDVKKIVLNLTGLDLVKAVYEWRDLVPEFYTEFQKNNITLEQLQHVWYSMNPKNNITTIEQRKFLVYLAKHDEMVSYDQGKLLVDRLQRQNNVGVYVNHHLKHFNAAVINLFKMYQYIPFLRQTN